MFLGKKAFQFAASTAILASAFAAGNASAAKNLNFSATINTLEFQVPSDICSSGMGGVGAGSGTSNLFAKNPSKDTAPIVLASSDCLLPSPPSPDTGLPTSLTFFQGGFVLTGPGGDSLTATYGGTLDIVLDPAVIPSGITVPQGSLAYKFKDATAFTIVSGTGRYAKAKGGGQISGFEIVNFGTHISQGYLNASGSITY
jgi:hypothetical protein